MFTINADCVPYYEQLGIAAFHLDFGYNPEFDTAVTESDPAYVHDVALVANAYDIWVDAQSVRRLSVETLVRPLVDAGCDIVLWGKGWEPLFGPGSEPETTNRYFPELVFLGPGRIQLNHLRGRHLVIPHHFLAQAPPSAAQPDFRFRPEKTLPRLAFLIFFGHYNLEPARRCVLLRGSLTPSKR